MNTTLCDEIGEALSACGFSVDGTSPRGTMTLTRDYLLSVEFAELFDQLVSRREKIFRSTDAVGADVAKAGFSDVVAAIDALKSVLFSITDAYGSV